MKPLADRVIVEPAPKEEKTASGIVIPDNSKEKPIQGKVIAVGPGKRENGKLIPPEVRVGDTVVFNKYAGTEIKMDGKEYLFMRESDILAIIE
jgi:chaperonin GroES